MAAIRIHAGFRRKITLTGLDRFGNSVIPENLVLTDSDATIATGVGVEGNSFYVNAPGKAGVAQVNVDGDGRQGEGTAVFATVLDFEVLPGDLAEVSVGTGEEEAIPEVVPA